MHMGKKMMVSFIEFYYFVLDIILLAKLNFIYTQFFENNPYSVGANKVKEKAADIFEQAVNIKNEIVESLGKKHLFKFFKSFKL